MPIIRFLTIAAAATLALGLAQAKPAKTTCVAEATSVWLSAGDDWKLEAFAMGPDCAKAVALIVIRDKAGEVQYTQAHTASQLMTLAGATDVADMTAKLTGWIGPNASAIRTTGDLPEWKADAEQPGGEFPFMPTEGTDRDSYEAMRASKAPVFCYVQGMESLNCVKLDKESGSVSEIGLQLFPG